LKSQPALVTFGCAEGCFGGQPELAERGRSGPCFFLSRLDGGRQALARSHDLPPPEFLGFTQEATQQTLTTVCRIALI
jgi:hypothetical protein